MLGFLKVTVRFKIEKIKVTFFLELDKADLISCNLSICEWLGKMIYKDKQRQAPLWISFLTWQKELCRYDEKIKDIEMRRLSGLPAPNWYVINRGDPFLGGSEI